MKLFCLIIAFFVLTSSVAEISAQQSDRDRGIDLYKQGKDAQAIAVLEKVAKQKEFNDDSEIWNFLGLSYINSDDSKKAQKALEKAVKLQPENSIYRANLAYVYLLTRKIDKSQNEAEKALQLDANNVFAYYLIGTMNLWEGKLDDALTNVEKIFPINIGFAQAYMLKSDVLIATLGNVFRAAQVSRKRSNF